MWSKVKIKQNGSAGYTQSPPFWQELFISLGFSICVVCVCVCALHGSLFVAPRVQRSTIKFRVTFTPINHRRGTASASAILSRSDKLGLKMRLYLPALHAYHSGHACGTSHGWTKSNVCREASNGLLIVDIFQLKYCCHYRMCYCRIVSTKIILLYLTCCTR